MLLKGAVNSHNEEETASELKKMLLFPISVQVGGGCTATDSEISNIFGQRVLEKNKTKTKGNKLTKSNLNVVTVNVQN